MDVTTHPSPMHCMCDILCACTLFPVSYLGNVCACTQFTRTRESVCTIPLSGLHTQKFVRTHRHWGICVHPPTCFPVCTPRNLCAKMTRIQTFWCLVGQGLGILFDPPRSGDPMGVQNELIGCCFSFRFVFISDTELEAIVLLNLLLSRIFLFPFETEQQNPRYGKPE